MGSARQPDGALGARTDLGAIRAEWQAVHGELATVIEAMLSQIFAAASRQAVEVLSRLEREGTALLSDLEGRQSVAQSEVVGLSGQLEQLERRVSLAEEGRRQALDTADRVSSEMMERARQEADVVLEQAEARAAERLAESEREAARRIADAEARAEAIVRDARDRAVSSERPYSSTAFDAASPELAEPAVVEDQLRGLADRISRLLQTTSEVTSTGPTIPGPPSARMDAPHAPDAQPPPPPAATRPASELAAQTMPFTAPRRDDAKRDNADDGWSDATGTAAADAESDATLTDADDAAGEVRGSIDGARSSDRSGPEPAVAATDSFVTDDDDGSVDPHGFGGRVGADLVGGRDAEHTEADKPRSKASPDEEPPQFGPLAWGQAPARDEDRHDRDRRDDDVVVPLRPSVWGAEAGADVAATTDPYEREEQVTRRADEPDPWHQSAAMSDRDAHSDPRAAPYAEGDADPADPNGAALDRGTGWEASAPNVEVGQDGPRVDTLIFQAVPNFQAALALERALKALPGVDDVRVADFDERQLSFQVEHDLGSRLATGILALRSHDLELVESEDGRAEFMFRP